MLNDNKPTLTISPIGVQPLRGRRIVLQRSNSEHAEFMHRCYQDAEFMNQYRLAQIRTESIEEIRERLAKEHEMQPQQRRCIEWVILDVGGGEALTPIGLASLADYIASYNRAELLVGILDKSKLKTGSALEATLLIMDFAFNTINLHKLTSLVYGFNDAAQQNTLQLGFSQEGYLLDHIHYPKLGFVDMYQNGLLENKFRANKRLSSLSKRLLHRDITHPPEQVTHFDAAQLKDAKKAFEESLQSHLSNSSIKRSDENS